MPNYSCFKSGHWKNFGSYSEIVTGKIFLFPIFKKYENLDLFPFPITFWPHLPCVELVLTFYSIPRSFSRLSSCCGFKILWFSNSFMNRVRKLHLVFRSEECLRTTAHSSAHLLYLVLEKKLFTTFLPLGLAPSNVAQHTVRLPRFSIILWGQFTSRRLADYSKS